MGGMAGGYWLFKHFLCTGTLRLRSRSLTFAASAILPEGVIVLGKPAVKRQPIV